MIAIEFAGYLSSHESKSSSMDIVGVTPHQLAPTVGMTGSRSMGSPAPSPVAIDSLSPVIIDSPSPVAINLPSPVIIDSPSPVAIDSPQSTRVNFFPRSLGSPLATLRGFNLMIGTLNFYIDNAGVGQLLPTAEAATSAVDSALEPPVVIQQVLTLDSMSPSQTTCFDAQQSAGIIFSLRWI
jgi:hypothetical protein